MNHAISGAAAWVAVTGAAPLLATGVYPLDPIGVVVGATVCAGAALLPDADHHSATISRSVPVLGPLTARLVGALSGGHRHGAHSPVGVLVVAAAAWALTVFTVAVEPIGGFDPGTVAIGAGLGTAALTAFALKARDLVDSWIAAWLAGVALGLFIVVFAPEQIAWFPLAVTLGFVAHLAGDALTTGGLPGLFWPWVPRPPDIVDDIPVLNRLWLQNGYVALPILGDTGSWREKAFGGLLTLYCTLGLGYEVLRGVGLDRYFAG
ncbi:metal-dependent hydrolase [Agromyces sp. NPDC058136]|uniref:metal-dependent hydrolase n=1 Tax=Agromyces sp. NPDC058136 TaxID=3346354 RepID=UPI0036D90AA3